ncbi:DNA-3-methyladenine glycosylase [Chryseobacterium hagamense]|uniref:Putative 3-methyladenine DNA glycosylase n=1 Tax=Chryseobacterium hagamense TaxID=395935 RepID=A0A511YGH9_9FLAO|nr:DNA-3-methyladenine glycosylase [Chryseobacterium hagamense]GEN74317.1 putative 3-methyladenine DNA glycosylase [Chryseobacterium hagamense]
MKRKLKSSYYRSPDVEFLAKDLLGKILYTCKDGQVTAGLITETEAYFGDEDKASHAFGNRRTARTEIMYGPGGFAYVYLCYGIHYLLNVVVSGSDDPKCVLIRAIEPYSGQEIMEERRKMPVTHTAVSSGPGSLSKALGIDVSFNRKDLTEDEIWIEDIGKRYAADEIAAVPRVGIAYAQEHAHLPLRFYLKDNRFVSKKLKST